MGFLDFFKGNKASDNDLKNINSLNINYKTGGDPVVAEPAEAAETIHSENASFREKTIGIKEVLLNKYLKPFKFGIEPGVILDLSLTELIELYDVYMSYYKSISEKSFEGNVADFDLFTNVIQLKLLKEKSVYCVYSKKTGEPFMNTLKSVNIEKGEFECTSPGIILYTREYKEEAEKSLKNVDEIELREIVNLKEDGNCNNAIEELLIKAVYSNGADVVFFNSYDSVVMGEDLVNRPKELAGEILNPKLVKWLLLIGQMGEIERPLEMAEYDYYYDMIEKSVIEAKLLMPVQHPEKKPKALVEASKGRSGKVSNRKNYRIGTSKNMGINKEDDSQKGVTIRNDGGNLRVIYRSRIKLSVIKGKKGRKAICLFTDMKRLRDMYSSEWTGMIQSPGKIINAVDLVINLSSYKKGGLYISEEMYKEMENKYLKK